MDYDTYKMINPNSQVSPFEFEQLKEIDRQYEKEILNNTYFKPKKISINKVQEWLSNDELYLDYYITPSGIGFLFKITKNCFTINKLNVNNIDYNLIKIFSVPNTWPISKVIKKNNEACELLEKNEIENAKEAQDSCPVSAITITQS